MPSASRPSWARIFSAGVSASWRVTTTVSSLATTYAVSADDSDQGNRQLAGRLKQHWSLPTALAFLVWFVFAPQCMSTIAVTRRETNGWKWPGFMLLYLFALAYIFAGITYWSAVALGL